MSDETNAGSLRPSGALGTEEDMKAFFEAYDTRKRAEDAEEKLEADAKELLTNRVSVAAIALTLLLSFIGFARENRSSASEAAALAAQRAKADLEAEWGYYATRAAERASYRLADETLMREVLVLADSDPRLGEAAVHHASYATRIEAIDDANRLVFFSIQDSERERLKQLRTGAKLDKQISRYDMGTQVLTLALVVISVTLLANRTWLFWLGLLIATIGAAIAVDGYFMWL